MAVRDTDTDWHLIGETDPFWGVASMDAFKAENVTDQALAEFYSSGQGDIQLVVERASRFLGEWRAPRRALDFGCGVGRLAFAMAQWSGQVVGYDVSPG